MQEKQKVITRRVYRFVRHPMYLGLFAMFLSGAVMCGSIWGAVISLLSLVVLAIRVNLEEKMLEQELDGYEAYKKKTRFRIIPYIW